jgi:hypothetical protein
MFKKNSQKNNWFEKRMSRQSGFTIVETLVAIFILVIAVTGPLAVAQSGLRAAFLSRDQTTAFYLAQDAFEYVKNVRDGNILETVKSGAALSGGWLDGLEPCMDVGGCTVETTFTSGSVVGCGLDDEETGCDPEDHPLKYDLLDNTFGFESVGSEDSIYSRKVYITEIVEGVEAEILVEIKWTTSSSLGQRTISVRENIFNWTGI